MSFEVARNTGDNDVKSFDGERIQTRKFPHNVLGSRGHAGAQQTFREIIANALDEVQNGRADKITVWVYKDGSVKVQDNGSGVPLAFNKVKGEYNWHLVYNRYYAGTKYGDRLEELQRIYRDENLRNNFSSKNSGDFDVFGLGAHGMGGAGSQFTSDFFNVDSKRQGVHYRMEFVDGNPVGQLQETPLEDPTETGTTVHWRPADEVFDGEGGLKDAWVRNECYNLALVKGVAITYIYEGEEPVVMHPESFEKALDGIVDGCTTDVILNWSTDGNNYKVTENTICVGATKHGKARQDIFFQNNMRMRGGLHQQAVDEGLRAFFTGYRDANGNSLKLRESDYENLLSVAVSTYAVKPDFYGQAKSYLDFTSNNMYIAADIKNALVQVLNKSLAMGEKWLTDAIENARLAREAREVVAHHKALARDIKKSSSSKKPITSQKFISCTNYEKGDYKNVEIYFVEGDSAGVSVKQGRDSDTQALIFLGGKPMNGHKSTLEGLLNNKEVRLILSVLGTGVELDLDEELDEEASFDMSKLKAGALYLMTDGDKDGLHIRILVFTLLYRLVPKILDAGLLNIVDAPLYMVRENGTSNYFYSGEEYTAWCEEKSGREKLKTHRYKGLGEMDAEDVHNSLMSHTGNRRVTNVQVDTNAIELVEALELLFGKVNTRRELIINQLLEDGMSYSDIREQLRDFDSIVEQYNIESGLEYSEVEMLVAG